MHEEALSLDDVGTRRDHYLELYELWSFGLGVLNGPILSREGTEKRRATLEGALKMLYSQLETGYSEKDYVRAVNMLPEASMIEGGRGTPLKENDETKST